MPPNHAGRPEVGHVHIERGVAHIRQQPPRRHGSTTVIDCLRSTHQQFVRSLWDSRREGQGAATVTMQTPTAAAHSHPSSLLARSWRPSLRRAISSTLSVFSIPLLLLAAISAAKLMTTAGLILLETKIGGNRVTVARVPAETTVAAGDQVRLSVQPGRLHFFDPDNELPILG
jgi:hypothetical protein